jgi:hypothetical protein
MQQGQRQNLEGEMLNDGSCHNIWRIDSCYKTWVNSWSIESINGKDAMLWKTEKTTLYYDVASVSCWI